MYPAQVQYVEGGDAVYANGAMYVFPVGPWSPQTLDSPALCGTFVEAFEHVHTVMSLPVLGSEFRTTGLGAIGF